MLDYETYTEILLIRDMIKRITEPQIEKAYPSAAHRQQTCSPEYRRLTLKDARTIAHHATIRLNILAEKLDRIS